MSLETVVEDIREDARERAAEIREEAENEAEAIVEDAEQEAAEIRQEREQEIERRIEQEREQARSSANLEAKQERLEARRDVLERVREATEERLATLDDERRRELTRALIDAAAPEFEAGESVAVHGRAEDEALIEDILTEYEGWTYAGDRDCLGGVVVESEESRVRVNNTFDSLLDEIWDENLKAISDRLFDDEQ